MNDVSASSKSAQLAALAPVLLAPVLVAAVWLVVERLQQPPPHSGAVVLEDALVRATASRADWQPVSLPWRSEQAGAGYELQLVVPPQMRKAQQPALLSQRVVGALDSDSARPDELRAGRTGLLLPLLPPLPERITLNLEAPEGFAELGRVHLGPVDALAAWLTSMERSMARVFETLSAILLITTGVIGFLFANQRRPALGWLTVCTAAWTLLMLVRYVAELPLRYPQFGLLVGLLLIVFMVSGMMFATHVFGLAGRWIRPCVAVGAAYALVVTLVEPGPLGLHPEQVLRVSLAPLMLLGIVLIAAAIPVYRRAPSADGLAIICVTVIIMVLGAFDYMSSAYSSPGTIPYAGYATPVMLFCFCAVFVRRFITTLRETQALNADLERRVADKSRELAALERERALTAERERIMREMHDGVGGYLVSTLALADQHSVDNPELTEMVQRALADLRMMIDSLDEADLHLKELLATVRANLDLQMQVARIDSRWQLADTPQLVLTPGQALSVMRILQEAFANVVKHAGASRIDVTVAADDDSVEVRVVDDGRGFDADTVRRGRGLTNMQRRAAEQGMQLDTDSSPGAGTCLRLTIPRRQADLEAAPA